MGQPVTGRELFGWAMYDFANSSYTTVIVTVYYAVVFPKVIVGDAPDFRLGNLLWSVALSSSYLLTALTLPLLGAWMDRTGQRKRFLLASTVLTVLATAALGLTGPGTVALAMIAVVVSNYGFSVGESFVAAFLPDLGPPERLGRISGMAWGLGYLGGLGSTLLVLGGLGVVTPDNPLVRWAGPITALWFAVAAIPTFLWVRDRAAPKPLPPGSNAWTAGLVTLLDTARHLPRYRDLMVFLGSHLFAMAGLSIVVSFAFVYGDQVIHWSVPLQGGMFVLTQLSAALGALGFGWFQGRIGDLRTYAVTLVLWCLAVALLRLTGPVAAAIPGVEEAHVLLLVGALAGACMGATQSAARTIVALLSPPERVGEFFGLWGTFGKLAAVFGLLSLGGLQAALGLKDAILLCGVFFAIGLAILLGVDVDRGRKAATTEAGSASVLQ
ncbi:MAG: MFS transporter [Myxococcota bacterium]